MASRKISQLSELATTPAADDLIQVVDVSDTTFGASGTNKKIQYSNLVGGGDQFLTYSGGAYISSTGTFFYLPCSGASQIESSVAQWYSRLALPANCRLYDVAVIYQRGSTGRTINLSAFDFNNTPGPDQNLGSSTNGPLAATNASYGSLVFNFNTSDFDYTSSSQMSLGVTLAGSTTTVLGFSFSMRFLLT